MRRIGSLSASPAVSSTDNVESRTESARVLAGFCPSAELPATRQRTSPASDRELGAIISRSVGVKSKRPRAPDAASRPRISTRRSSAGCVFGSLVLSSASRSSTRAFCGFLSERRHEAQLVVLRLRRCGRPAPVVTRDDAHADDALLRLRGERLDGRLRHVAVADAGDHDALGAGRGRGVDQRAVHVLVRHDDVHARQRRRAVHRELGRRACSCRSGPR